MPHAYRLIYREKVQYILQINILRTIGFILFTALFFWCSFCLVIYCHKRSQFVVKRTNALEGTNHAAYYRFGGPNKTFGTRENPLDDTSLADYLKKEVRVLCWILTTKEMYADSVHLKRTWGSRCNKFILLNNVPRQTKWSQMLAAYEHIRKEYSDTYDWFYAAEDHTYTIVENLRYLLYPYSPETPIYFSCKYKSFVRQNYTSGGAGYVLSREALRRFLDIAVPNRKICAMGSAKGNVYKTFEKCLHYVKVYAGDTRDQLGRRRIFPTEPDNLLIPGDVYNKEWSMEYVYFKRYEGSKCCSKYFITFHYVRPNIMYALEYLIYHARVHGRVRNLDVLPNKINAFNTTS